MASIVVSCQTCGQRFKAPASAVGKRVKCTFCEGEIIIAEAGDPELSMSGFIDLEDEPPPAAEPERELPRRGSGGGRRTKTKARTRDRETLFDLSADDVPRRRPRPSGKPAGGGAGRTPTKRGNTGMRRRPEPEPERGRGGGGGGGSRGGGGGKKSGVNPLVLAAAGGGLLLLLIIAIVAMSSSAAQEKIRVKKREDDRVAKEVAAREKEQARERRAEQKRRFKAAKDKADELYTKEEQEWTQVRMTKRKAGITIDEDEKFASVGAGKAFVEAARTAEDAGEKSIALKYYGKAVGVDPNNKTARLALGHERYQKPTGDEIDTLAMEGLLEALDAAHDKWFDKTGMAEIKETEARLVAAAKAEMSRRANDPMYKVVAQVRRNLRSQEILKDITWKDSYAEPYLVFEQQRGNAKLNDPASAARLANKLAILQHLYGYFEKTWAKPFGLTRDETEPLKILVMSDQRQFAEFNAKSGVGAPPGVIAYYEPRNKWVVLYNGVQTRRDQSKEEIETLNDGVCFHEGTHQLVDAYVNRGKASVRERIGRSRWVDEGLCEYIGAVKVTRVGGKKSWELEQRHDHRIKELNSWLNGTSPVVQRIRQQYRVVKSQNPNMPALGPPPPIYLSLREMVSSYVYPDVGRHLSRKYPQPYGPPLARMGVSVVYAQSVQFWHFCMNYENGKYKEPLLDYLRWEWGLRPGAKPPPRTRQAGQICLRAFEMIFKDVDLDTLELEYWKYCDGLIKAVVGSNAGVPQSLFDSLNKK